MSHGSESKGKGGDEGARGDRQWRHIDVDELQIQDQIGGGGFALVHEGTWKGQRVAIKTLFDPNVDEQLKTEFMDELMTMSRVAHDNVVQLLGACARPPKLCFVMELCGSSVYHLLHLTRTPLTAQQKASILLDTARGMCYLHAQRPAIVHRDLKTHNLLIDMRGRIKVCDFGLASARARMAGTPNYMAPELLRAHSTFSKSVDVYAFGVVAWEVAARKVPFDGLDPEAIVQRVTEGERPELPRHSCSPELCSLIERCWSHDPAARPSFEEIVPILEAELGRAPSESYVAEASKEADALDSLLGK